MDEEFVQESAPANIQELFDKVDEMGKNKAMIRFADGTFSDEIGPSKLGDALSEAEEAETVLINGSVSEKVMNYVNQSSASTVVGTKEGKGFEASEELTVWFADVHR